MSAENLPAIPVADPNGNFPVSAVREAAKTITTLVETEFPSLRTAVANGLGDLQFVTRADGDMIGSGTGHDNVEKILIVAHELTRLHDHKKIHGLPKWFDEWLALMCIEGGYTNHSAAIAVGTNHGATSVFFSRNGYNHVYGMIVAQANKATRDRLVAEVYRRAMDPNDKASSTLLIFAAKQSDPSFRDNSTNITVHNNAQQVEQSWNLNPEQK